MKGLGVWGLSLGVLDFGGVGVGALGLGSRAFTTFRN